MQLKVVLETGHDVEQSESHLSQEDTQKITEVSEKLKSMGHRGFCGIWVGNTAEDLLADVLGLRDVHILHVLLAAERNRQRGLKRRKRNMFMIRELQRRLWAELVIRSPMIEQLRVNKTEADTAALKLVAQLPTIKELECAKEIIQSGFDETFESTQTSLLDRVLCVGHKDTGAVRRVEKDVTDVTDVRFYSPHAIIDEPSLGKFVSTTNTQASVLVDCHNPCQSCASRERAER